MCLILEGNDLLEVGMAQREKNLILRLNLNLNTFEENIATNQIQEPGGF